jgi:hypothetical protein
MKTEMKLRNALSLGAAEGLAIDGAAHLDEALSAEKGGGIGHRHVGPTALGRRFPELGFESLV